MRRYETGLLEICRKFQSTHPLRDATTENGNKRIAIDISIHAPLTGCDKKDISQSMKRSYFNPRTPYGMRHSGRCRSHKGVDFNPRTPYGMRHRKMVKQNMMVHFNPRTPYGMRQRPQLQAMLSNLFQSTHPLRDATLTFSV